MKMKGEGKEEKENITREDRREEGSVHFFDSHAVRFSLVGRNEKQQLGHSSPQLRPSFGIRSTRIERRCPPLYPSLVKARPSFAFDKHAA